MGTLHCFRITICSGSWTEAKNANEPKQFKIDTAKGVELEKSKKGLGAYKKGAQIEVVEEKAIQKVTTLSNPNTA